MSNRITIPRTNDLFDVQIDILSDSSGVLA